MSAAPQNITTPAIGATIARNAAAAHPGDPTDWGGRLAQVVLQGAAGWDAAACTAFAAGLTPETRAYVLHYFGPCLSARLQNAIAIPADQLARLVRLHEWRWQRAAGGNGPQAA